MSLSMCSLSGNSGMLLKKTFRRNFGILVPLCFFLSIGLATSFGIRLVYFSSNSAGSYNSSSSLLIVWLFSQVYLCYQAFILQYYIIERKPSFNNILCPNQIVFILQSQNQQIFIHIIKNNNRKIQKITPPSPHKKMQQTRSQKQIAENLSYLKKTLLKLGCNLIPTSPTSSLSQFCQPTGSRLELIEWLIATISPGYKLDIDYKNYYHEDPHLYRIKKISIILWKIGVMPITKFTKNLDYDKYVEGLLGEESAIALLVDLVTLAQEKFMPNIGKLEDNANQLLKDLIRNNSELVNVFYEPYGVTFPNKYYKKSNDNDYTQENQIKQMYGSMLKQLNQQKQEELKIPKRKQKQQDEESSNDNKQNEEQSAESDRLLSQLQTYRELFTHKYQKLSTSITQILQKYSKILPQNPKTVSEVSCLHEKRTLKIDKNLCKQYKTYKKMLSSIEEQGYKTNLKELKQQTLELINDINNVQF